MQKKKLSDYDYYCCCCNGAHICGKKNIYWKKYSKVVSRTAKRNECLFCCNFYFSRSTYVKGFIFIMQRSSAALAYKTLKLKIRNRVNEMIIMKMPKSNFINPKINFLSFLVKSLAGNNVQQPKIIVIGFRSTVLVHLIGFLLIFHTNRHFKFHITKYFVPNADFILVATVRWFRVRFTSPKWSYKISTPRFWEQLKQIRNNFVLVFVLFGFSFRKCHNNCTLMPACGLCSYEIARSNDCKTSFFFLSLSS